MWREMRGERKRERERERKQEGANSNELVRTRKKSVLLRALGAQPRRRKPAFVTHDNEASLCVCHDDPAAIPAAPSLSLRRG